MESASAPAAQDPAPAQDAAPTGRGTLADPEILKDVPGHVIPIIEREFDDFKTEATRFLAGDTPEDEFIKFRLKQGVYGQRQPDVNMVRVKLPFGGVTPEQMESFADVVEKHAPLNKGHITTRQNVQIHHIPLAQMEPAIRELSESGLSSREGCGNTVRNVTGDPWAGVAKDELFDMTPYAGAYVRYFVRHPTTQAMPRKIKTAFDGSPRDRAISGIHDIAFRARAKEIEGRGTVRGAEMLVGGGTSIMPRVAPVLYEFVELDNGEYLRIAEAVFRIFDRQDWLRGRTGRARGSRCSSTSTGSTSCATRSRRSARATGSSNATSRSRTACSWTTSASRRRRRASAIGSPNGDLSEFERFRRRERARAEAAGLRDGRGESPARRPHAGAVPRPGGGDARVRRQATRARRCSRTWSCAGCARRASTTCSAR